MESDPNGRQHTNDATLEHCLGYKLTPQLLTITNWESLVNSRKAETGAPSFELATAVNVPINELEFPQICDPFVYTKNGLIRKLNAVDIDYPSVAWLSDGRFKYTSGAFTCYAGLAIVEIRGVFYPKLFHFLRSQPLSHVQAMLGGTVAGGYFGSASLRDPQDKQSSIYYDLGLAPIFSGREMTTKSGFHIMADLENKMLYYAYSDALQ
jgi:hypothetical protein